MPEIELETVVYNYFYKLQLNNNVFNNNDIDQDNQ